MAFSEQGPRTVCILSANGAICNVTLRQPATQAGTVSYEVSCICYYYSYVQVLKLCILYTLLLLLI